MSKHRKHRTQKPQNRYGRKNTALSSGILKAITIVDSGTTQWLKMLLRKRKLQQRSIRRLPESNTCKRRKRRVLCRSPPGIIPYDQNIDTALVGILQL